MSARAASERRGERLRSQPAIAVECAISRKRFGAFIAVDHVSFAVAPRRGLRLPRPQRRRQDDDDQDAVRPARCRAPAAAAVAGFDIATEREPDQAPHRLHVAALLALRRPHGGGEHRLLRRPLRRRRSARSRRAATGSLEMAGLADQRDRLTGELALGWKQRLALGCAVLHEPPILFLDEPTSGVDPISRRRFWDLIYDLADGGTTVFVTHALHGGGRVLPPAGADEPRPADRARHAGGPARRLRAPLLELRTPDAIAALAALDGAPGVLRRRALRARSARHGRATRRRLAPLCRRSSRRRGVGVSGLREIAPSLEDVFVSLVQSAGGAVEDVTG